MLNRLLLLLLICTGVVTLTNAAFAQTVADSINYEQPLSAAVENSFYSAIGQQSRLYDGKGYSNYDPAFIGNAFFFDNADWSVGSVFYDGYLYKNVDLIYDLYKDRVVTHLYSSLIKIELVPEKVRDFDLLNHHFIYLVNDPANSTSVKTGYYDELYAGKIAVLAKRQKTLQQRSGFSGTIESYFTATSTDYYIYKNGKYYSVSSEGSFIDVLKDKKAGVRQFIKSNKIKFNKDREAAMAKIAAYYDQLNN